MRDVEAAFAAGPHTRGPATKRQGTNYDADASDAVSSDE